METYTTGFSQKNQFLNTVKANYSSNKLKSPLTKGANKKKLAQQYKADQIKKRKQQQNYFKMKQAEEEKEKQSIQDKTNAIRPHQIYSNTFYYPNNKTKVFCKRKSNSCIEYQSSRLEVAIVSNLYFQMLLYFNFFFSFLFFTIFLSTSVIKVGIFQGMQTLYFRYGCIPIIQISSLQQLQYFGYRLRFSEYTMDTKAIYSQLYIFTYFPELIAFLIFTGFSLTFVIIFWIQKIVFPIEVGALIFESIFIVSELLLGMWLVRQFMIYSSSLFILRGQTMLDKDLQLYHSFQTLKTSRQIELGLKKSTQQTRRAEGIFQKQIDQILSRYGSSINGDGGDRTPYSRLQQSLRF